MIKKLIELSDSEQQIVLICKGHSKLELTNYEKVKNVISHVIGCEATDYSMFYWLSKVIMKIDKELDLNFRNRIIETMFSTDWIFPNISQIDSISMIEMNKKFITLMLEIPVMKDDFKLINLNPNNIVLNTIYKGTELLKS